MHSRMVLSKSITRTEYRPFSLLVNSESFDSLFTEPSAICFLLVHVGASNIARPRARVRRLHAPKARSPILRKSSSVRYTVPSAAPRRTRPMLGLASRHFEAALSGAGVDRKARRERDQARENKDGAHSGVQGS